MQQVERGVRGEGGGQGEREGEEVNGVGASGAELEGRAAKGAVVEANAPAVAGWRGARVRGGLP